MIKKRWTPEEDSLLLKQMDEWKRGEPGITEEAIFEMIVGDFEGRTALALNKRYYTLKTSGNERKYIRKDEQYNAFLDGLQALKTAHDNLIIENKRLTKRNEELEKQLADFEALARVMEHARKLVVNEDLGEYEKPRFKQDVNGNLERIG